MHLAAPIALLASYLIFAPCLYSVDTAGNQKTPQVADRSREMGRMNDEDEDRPTLYQENEEEYLREAAAHRQQSCHDCHETPPENSRSLQHMHLLPPSSDYTFPQ